MDAVMGVVAVIAAVVVVAGGIFLPRKSSEKLLFAVCGTIIVIALALQSLG